MDTDAIYHSVCAYGAAKAARCTFDAWDHIDAVKRLLNEADAERQELLATNERLVDEVADLKSAVQIYLGVVQERNRLESENAELKAKLTDKASLLSGCYARINTLERTLTHIHGVAMAEDHRDLPGIAKDAKEALEKKNEAAT